MSYLVNCYTHSYRILDKSDKGEGKIVKYKTILPYLNIKTYLTV